MTIAPFDMNLKLKMELDESSSAETLAGAIRRELAENDALIRSANLANGNEIVKRRTAVFARAIARWAEERQQAFGYRKPFAVVAIGGTGRAEMTPRSDLDLAFLFEDGLAGEGFMLDLQNRTIHGDEFKLRHGFSIEASCYGLEHVPEICSCAEQLNAFIDMAPIHDPCGLAAVFRDRIRESFDPFEHFLDLRRFFRRHWKKADASAERIDRFDLKEEALRLFQCGVWVEGGKDFEHSHRVHARLEASHPRDLEAYHFLLRVRSWIQIRRQPAPAVGGRHPEDLMEFADFLSFGEMLGPEATAAERKEFAAEVRGRILTARRRIATYARGVFGRELRQGRRIAAGSPVFLGPGGLAHDPLPGDAAPGERSRAVFALLLASRRYRLRIDRAELHGGVFDGAGDWLQADGGLGALFRESRGSLVESLEFLARIPGALDRIFPGYGRFESSVDARVLEERRELRGALARRKVKALEAAWNQGMGGAGEVAEPGSLVDTAFAVSPALETARLAPELLAAVNLALVTKRLPLTSEDLDERTNPSAAVPEGHNSGFSGIPSGVYYEHALAAAGFGERTLETARFLVENRRLFKDIADTDLMDGIAVERLLGRCGRDPDRVRALFVFTAADRAEWESARDDPARWQNIRELYAKSIAALGQVRNAEQTFLQAGCDPEELAVVRSFGRDLFEGIYRYDAIRFGGHLLELARSETDGAPKAVAILRRASVILGVAARNDRGLAASICGALWKLGVPLRQAHLFSSPDRGLAMDFFHLAAPDPLREGSLPALPEICRAVEDAIAGGKHLDPGDVPGLLPAGPVTLAESRPGLFRLQAESVGPVGDLLYTLALKAYHHIGADVHALAAHARRDGSRAVVHLSLPDDVSPARAASMAAGW